MPFYRQNELAALQGPFIGPNTGYTVQQPTLPMPTGMPTGPVLAGPSPIPPSVGMPAPMQMPAQTQIPPAVESPLYTAGFLRTQIGRRMRVEFLIGSGALVDRTGTLVGVGSSYILLQPIESDDIMLCDLYSIKFVTIIL